MAKANIIVNDSVNIEVEGESTRELFKEIASVQEVFGEKKCGCCGCTDIRMVVRKNKDDEDFFEYQCQGFLPGNKGRCRAYLALGQNKKGGGLFPIRALIENLVGGKPGPEHGKPDRERGKFNSQQGWTRYRGEPKDDKVTR